MFDHVWEGIPRWSFMDTDAIATQSFGAPADYRATIPRQARIIDRVEHLVMRQRRVGPPGLVHRQFQNNAPDDLHQRHWTVGLFVATVGHPVGGMGDGVFEEAASCGSLVIEPPVCRWAIANTRSRVV